MLLEPDGLGIIPWYTPITGSGRSGAGPPRRTRPPRRATGSRCSTTRSTPSGANPGTRVYLDGTHSAWLGVGDVADRLHRAGVERADGFFLNVSNYRTTSELADLRRLDLAVPLVRDEPGRGRLAARPLRVLREPVLPVDRLRRHDGDGPVVPGQRHQRRQPAAGPRRPDALRRRHQPQRPGPVDAAGRRLPRPAGLVQPARPRPRACARRPTPATRWPTPSCGSRCPGESDGQCSRGLTDNGGVDPEWGRVDPAAGEWFPEQALELVRLAQPPL